MRAAVYTRVSSAEQRDEGLSLDLQRHRCEERARADGALTVEVFEDGGISGAKADNRPALQELLARLAEFDAVYVLKLDRLARSIIDTDTVLKACLAAPVRLVSLAENIDLSTAMGRFFVFVVALFAQMELERIQERVRDSVIERRRQGRRFGRPPLGYKPNPEKGKPMIVDPERLPVVREIFRRYAAGDSVSEVTRWLNREGIPSSWGTRWRMQQTTNVLRNPNYVGLMPVDGETVPAQHQAVLDADLWRTVQERMDDNAKVAPATRARTLSAVFRCGLCGGPMKRQKGGADGLHTSFGCMRRGELPPEQRHPPTWITEKKAVALCWKAVSYLISEEAIAEAQSRMLTQDSDAARTALLRERQQLADDVAYNLAAARAGAIDVALLAHENAPLNARLEEVDSLLAEHLRARQKLEGLHTITAAEVLEAVQSGDIEGQRRFLMKFFQRVEVHKGFLRFVPTVPEVPVFDVAIPRFYAPTRGGKCGELEFTLLTS